MIFLTPKTDDRVRVTIQFTRTLALPWTFIKSGGISGSFDEFLIKAFVKDDTISDSWTMGHVDSVDLAVRAA